MTSAAPRIAPTPEDMAVVARNLKRLMLWCGTAGVRIGSPQALRISRNFIADMTHFGPQLKEMTRTRRPIADRFWPKVSKKGPKECWPWTGAVNPHGYGNINEGGRGRGSILAHRISWELHFEMIPEGLHVLHRCDNPPCVNPAHLFLGTPAINTADKMAKGRHRCGPGMPGEGHPSAVLTADQVRGIRLQYIPRIITKQFLAEKYGVSLSTVEKIISRHLWAHI